MKRKKQEKLAERKPYNCENCGKLVEVKDWYSTGRFCCLKCSKSYAGKQANKNDNTTKGMVLYNKQKAIN